MTLESLIRDWRQKRKTKLMPARLNLSLETKQDMLSSSPHLELVLLGTGGGRFATMTQKRRTGGIRILYEKLNIHLDPGPGALVYSLKAGLDPQKINGVLVSHCHPDHCNDAEVFIEAMTRGMTKKKGVLVAAHSVLSGNEQCEASVSKYHQSMPAHVIDAKPGIVFSFDNLRVVAAEARHTDPDAVGFRFETPALGDIAYTSDSQYFEGIGKPYRRVRLLLLCVMRPAGSPWKGHMTSDDAVQIIEEAKPEMAILTHFGMQMIFKGPANEARVMQEKTGIPTVAGADDMHITVAEKVQIHTGKRKQHSLNEFAKTT
jgi:phosphoribosyl 1,2-cyclic phosphodiesterase